VTFNFNVDVVGLLTLLLVVGVATWRALKAQKTKPPLVDEQHPVP